jgi:hypothetical protein
LRDTQSKPDDNCDESFDSSVTEATIASSGGKGKRKGKTEAQLLDEQLSNALITLASNRSTSSILSAPAQESLEALQMKHEHEIKLLQMKQAFEIEAIKMQIEYARISSGQMIPINLDDDKIILVYSIMVYSEHQSNLQL